MSQCKKVFIFGSSKIDGEYLPGDCIRKIEKYIVSGYQFIVSDYGDISKIVQDILKTKLVKDVVIYTANDYIYNAWPEEWKYLNLSENIDFEISTKKEERAYRDFIACAECDSAFGIILNSISNYSYTIVEQLMIIGKHEIYIYSDPYYHAISNYLNINKFK